MLLPVRDAARTLGASIRSIRRQRGVEWECVIVCDGSRDGSRTWLREQVALDDRLVLIEQEAHGIVEALNRGLERCRAPLVARMDADDLMHRDRLRLQRDWLVAHPDHAGLGSRVRLFPRRGLREGRRQYERWLNKQGEGEADSIARDAYVECPLAHPTWMVRREVIAALRYRSCAWPEDYDLLLRALQRGHRFGCHPRRLLSWRDHPERLSRTHPDYALARFTECKAEHLAGGFLGGVSSYLLWGYGSTGRALRKALARRSIVPSHIIDMHPRRIGNRIHGAPVVSPSALASLSGRIVVSVAGEGPRALIRDALHALGRREGVDFICAA